MVSLPLHPLAITAFLASALSSLGAFTSLSSSPPYPNGRTRNLPKTSTIIRCPRSSVAFMSSDDEDPTKVWYASLANGIQNLLTNSPLNEGKKKVVQMLAGDYDEEAVRAKLNGLIGGEKAKGILDERGAQYKAVELDAIEDGKAIRAEMANVIGRTSVPAIWIDGVFIGGCNDGPPEFGGISSLSDSGKLDGMLQAAGAL